MQAPVLIYGSKEGCPACVYFEPEWEKICAKLKGKARIVKFNCTAAKPAPKPLAPYFTWFPSVILAEPGSYYRCFTPEDKVNEKDWSENNKITAAKFNAVSTGSGYEFGGKKNSAENVIAWFEEETL